MDVSTMNNLKDKVVIITGGANGIGAEIVKEFLKGGAKYVAIIDVNESLGKALETELRLHYVEEKLQFFNVDVTNDDQMSDVFHQVSKQFGVIDVLVNNAGIARDDPNYYKKEIEINMTAVISSTLKALQLMRKDQGGKGGTIINISSIAGLTLLSPSIFVYGATKSAVLHFSNCIGMEDYFRITNVRVMTVCFGITSTSIFDNITGIDNVCTEALKSIVQNFEDKNIQQTPTVAAQGVIQSFKSGKSGSTWLVDNNKTTEITADVGEAYKILSKHVTI